MSDNTGGAHAHFDESAEQSVLGTVLLSDVALGTVLDMGVRPKHFYREQHGQVLQVMMDLANQGEPVDVVTVRDGMLRDYGNGATTNRNIRAAVDMLAASVPAVGNLRGYCKIVMEKAKWRERYFAAMEQVAAIDREDPDDHTRALARADAADPRSAVSRVIPADDFMDWYDNPKVMGWETPYEKLTDAIGGGLVPGDVTVVAGWPGHGKTILADHFLLNCKWQGARCHAYVNELKTAIRTARMLARLTGVSWQKIRDKKCSPDEIKKLMEAVDPARYPFEYERIESWPVDDICRHIRRNRWDCAVIDTASRIPSRDVKETEYISGALADVARETDCHIFIVLQLNLERAKTAIRPAPTGRDLLGGGSWYRDARNVLFVHRHQVMATAEKAIVSPDGLAHVDCDKATHGEPENGYVPVWFNADRMWFEERVAGGNEDEDAPVGSKPITKVPKLTASNTDINGAKMAF